MNTTLVLIYAPHSNNFEVSFDAFLTYTLHEAL